MPVELFGLTINTEAVSAFAVLALVGYLLLKQYSCVFSVQFKSGKVKVTKGTVPPDFLTACQRLAANRNVKGSVFGYKTRLGVQLEFSANFPPLAKDKLLSAFPFQRLDKSFFRRKAPKHKLRRSPHKEEDE
ncbi:DUF3634 family protein [Gallaecimonas kandeliae]|uniref:DUF3634 family protein n=1 Tax=Gallaecimonas kandeliae TaxID=3029055 RepID=UPI002647B367|nr:DUF3634 family protein [Gallaecimonas kandeliae]WKE66692.1 DUF3634 family protein [Gallaecimonas kandeliae]